MVKSNIFVLCLFILCSCASPQNRCDEERLVYRQVLSEAIPLSDFGNEVSWEQRNSPIDTSDFIIIVSDKVLITPDTIRIYDDIKYPNGKILTSSCSDTTINFDTSYVSGKLEFIRRNYFANKTTNKIKVKAEVSHVMFDDSLKNGIFYLNALGKARTDIDLRIAIKKIGGKWVIVKQKILSIG